MGDTHMCVGTHMCRNVCVHTCVHVCMSVCHAQYMYEGQIAGVGLLPTFVCVRTELRLSFLIASVFTHLKPFCQPSKTF